MNIKSILLLNTVFASTMGSALLAENKFLVQESQPLEAEVSCSAPAGMIAVVSNILPKDAYLARTGPSIESDYVFSYFGLETQAFLTQGYMTTTDPVTAEICNQLEQGVVSAEIQQEFNAAIQSNLLWWRIDANKDLAFWEDQSNGDNVPEPPESTGYLSAKHVSFVSAKQWGDMMAPNILGYLSIGNRQVPLPITSIQGLNTENARALATGTKDALGYCVSGYDNSDLYYAFHSSSDDGYVKMASLSVGQTKVEIIDGVWSGCRTDVENEFVGVPVDATVEAVANCYAKTSNDYEVDAMMLPVSYGAMGGLGTNFATLCPVMTQEILQDDCDAGNNYSCDSLAELIERQ
jgi:hypothetical protein